MKNLRKKLALVLFVFIIITPAIVIAQDGGEVPPFDDETIDVPFDGGVSLLVAVGIGYGIKKIYDKRKEEKNIVPVEK